MTYDDLMGTSNIKNSREKEQNRDDSALARKPNQLGGLVSGLIGAMKSTVEDRPPFMMEIIEGERFALRTCAIPSPVDRCVPRRKRIVTLSPMPSAIRKNAIFSVG